VMADAARALKALLRLSEVGVRLAIDHFGAGYSSLAYLPRLPVDQLTIDQTLVTAMATGGADAATVCTIIGLGHSLGLRVGAEGVEGRDTLRKLAAGGCDLAQGYYL